MASAALLQLGYGASIASFLGGIHWALAMAEYGGIAAALLCSLHDCGMGNMRGHRSGWHCMQSFKWHVGVLCSALEPAGRLEL